MPSLLDTTREALRHYVDAADKLNPRISDWSVGMHVEHCALAMAGMATKLADSVGPEGSVLPAPPVKWSVPRAFITVTGIIPRGKGQAPRTVIPDGSLPKARVLAVLNAADERIATAVALPEDAWYNHHIFGRFRRDKTLWFMGVHNRHHLKIIRDILK